MYLVVNNSKLVTFLPECVLSWLLFFILALSSMSAVIAVFLCFKRGICGSNKFVRQRIKTLVRPMAKAYLDLYNSALVEIREFFGLRDFYR